MCRILLRIRIRTHTHDKILTKEGMTHARKAANRPKATTTALFRESLNGLSQ